MYLSARPDKSILLNTVLLFAYFMILVWVNNSYLYALYSYMGAAQKVIDLSLVMYLLLLAFACAFLCGGRIERPGDLFVGFFILVLVPHALVLNGANTFSPASHAFSGVALAVLIGISIISLVNKVHFDRRTNVPSKNRGRRMLVVLASLNIIVLAFIVAKSAHYFSFDFSGQYVRRAIAREVFATGTTDAYLASIGTQAIFPVLFAWGVYRKRRFFVSLGIFNVLVLWGAFGQKYPLIVLFLVYFLMVYFRRFGSIKVSWLVSALLALLMLGVIEHEVFGYSFLNDYLLRRTFIVPSTLLGAVDAFTANSGSNMYSDTLLGALFGQGRADPVTFRLGTEMFNSAEMNANVNFFAIAFMQLGFLGVVVESLIVAAIVIFLNYLFSRHRAVLAIPVALLVTTKIIEQSLLTVLLGSGIFAMVVVLALISLPFRINPKVVQ